MSILVDGRYRKLCEKGEQPTETAIKLWHDVERYLSELKRENKSPHTIFKNGNYLAWFIKWMSQNEPGITEWEHVKRATIQDAFRWKSEIDSVTPVSLNPYLFAIKSFFQFLISEERLDKNPAATIKAAKQISGNDHTFMSATDAIELIHRVAEDKENSTRNLVLIALLIYAGLRIFELCGLNIDDIDLNANCIRILGKGRKRRTIPIMDVGLRKVLGDYLQFREGLVALPRQEVPVAENPSDQAYVELSYPSSDFALFLGKDGYRIGVGEVREVLRTYLNEDDIGRITPHKLRHTFATLLHLNGAPIEVIRDLLGHSNIGTTQIYVGITEEEKRNALEKNGPLNGALENLLGM